jgi:hypothetical protein
MNEPDEDLDDLPTNFRRALERFAAIAPALRAGADPTDEISHRLQQVEKLFSRFDAVHLLGQFIYAETRMDAERYVESEHPGAAYIVELVGAVLVARTSCACAGDPEPAIDAHTTKPARELTGRESRSQRSHPST